MCEYKNKNECIEFVSKKPVPKECSIKNKYYYLILCTTLFEKNS